MAGRKERVGRVVSTKMQKTVVVAIEWRRVHRLYKKAMRRVTRFKAHDEHGISTEGDLVRIRETRPLSKDKRWRIVEVIEKGAIALLPDDAGGQK